MAKQITKKKINTHLKPDVSDAQYRGSRSSYEPYLETDVNVHYSKSTSSYESFPTTNHLSLSEEEIEWITTTHDFDKRPALQLTSEEVEWMYGCKNDGSTADIEDSEEIDDCVEEEEYGENLAKAREVIVIEDDSAQCEMSEEETLVIWHRLKNVLDWLLISFRRIKEHLADTGKVIQEAVVCPDTMTIMNNSTSRNLILYNCLISCSQNDISVVVDWLYNFLDSTWSDIFSAKKFVFNKV